MIVCISYQPCQVPVADERGTVAGAYVVLIDAAGRTVELGEIIPPEGDGPECWLGPLAGYAPEHVEYGDLEDAARRGAAGETGSFAIDEEGTR